LPSTSRRSSATQLVEILDWSRLPGCEEVKRIARGLSAGFTQAEIASELDLAEEAVAACVADLRLAMLEQAIERLDELPSDLYPLLERQLEAPATAQAMARAASRTQPRRRQNGSRIDWAAVKAWYLAATPRPTYSATARQFGISLSSVARRGRAEGWKLAR
jgi:hypothetical protein